MKLTKNQIRQLQKRLDEKKALPTMRIDQEEPETNKDEDSPLLKDMQHMDKLIGDYIKSLGSSN